MKKLVSSVLVLCMIAVALAGCGNKNTETTKATEATASTEAPKNNVLAILCQLYYTLFIDRINKFYKKYRTYGLFPEFILFNLKIIVLFNKQEFLYGIKTVRGLCGRC